MTLTTPLRKKTIIAWMLACIAVTGILGYEWIPEHLRGGWVLYLLLLASGAVLRVGPALALGLAAFLCTAVFMFYQASIGLHIEQQALLLVLNPMAPLWLSAIHHNLGLRRGSSSALLKLARRTRGVTLDLAASGHFMRQMDALCARSNLPGYRIIEVSIENHQLITEMLGEQAWQTMRLQMLDVLEARALDRYFVFADDGLTRLLFIEPGECPEDPSEPDFLRQLRGIRGLIIKASIQPRTQAAARP